MSLTTSQAFTNLTTTARPDSNSTHPEHDVRAFHRSLSILLIPITLIAIFCVLSGIFYYMLKKRRLDQLRHHLVPLYNFDPGEGDDWEADDLEPAPEPKQPKKLNDYKTMGSPNITTSPRL